MLKPPPRFFSLGLGKHVGSIGAYGGLFGEATARVLCQEVSTF